MIDFWRIHICAEYYYYYSIHQSFETMNLLLDLGMSKFVWKISCCPYCSSRNTDLIEGKSIYVTIGIAGMSLNTTLDCLRDFSAWLCCLITTSHPVTVARRVWIQSFPSPRLVTLPRLEIPLYPEIYPYLKEEINSCPSQIIKIFYYMYLPNHSTMSRIWHGVNF